MALVLLSGNAAVSRLLACAAVTGWSNITTKLRPPVKSILLLKPRPNIPTSATATKMPKTVKLVLYALINLYAGSLKLSKLPTRVLNFRPSHLSRAIMAV